MGLLLTKQQNAIYNVPGPKVAWTRKSQNGNVLNQKGREIK
ncbi:hypothetical protein MTR67_015557 [Solanum verrucosum]|uniref:Uncharacterized protein n=1 Tax=Solanum verrucosum TaxID=315347 RepID=A0AAF0QG11_SOLVR|nr:hypothetical protein MTR67_015557 [Solanum verrucosum]